MPLDLAAHLERIERHLPCLRAAAADPDALPALRAVVTAELAVWELAAELAALDRTNSNDPGAARSVPERLEAEAGHDA
jgi:hypothetical protein